jgi:hypothetical protein
MPLLTDDIKEARKAYAALESRAIKAEQRAEKLQALLTNLSARPAAEADTTVLLRQRILSLEGENISLQNQFEDLTRLKIDLLLQHFVESIGLAAAIGEASMPDRTIAAIATKIQAYVTPSNTGIGLRFHQPELGAVHAALSQTSFEIVKVPPSPGEPAPRNLYAVLLEKQRVYTLPFWSRFDQAGAVITEIAKTLSDSGAWNFPYLAQAAIRIAVLERGFAPSVAKVAPPETAATYEQAVSALEALAKQLNTKPNPVAGDLFALTSALDSTTSSLKTFLA